MIISDLYFQSSPQTTSLDPQELDNLMTELPQWEIQGLSVACLVREYKCADFLSAMALATRIAELAEHYDHHPELTIRWGVLGIKWWTHTANGITGNDVFLAYQCELLTEKDNN